jgi:transposase
MSEVVTALTPPGRTAHSRAFTREVWVDRLTRFPLSGLTPAQFCAIEAVSLPSFYSWKRRLAAEATASVTQSSPGVDRGPRLLPVRLQQPAAAVELVLPTGAVLRLPPGCDTAWVRSLVTALGDAPC